MIKLFTPSQNERINVIPDLIRDLKHGKASITGLLIFLLFSVNIAQEKKIGDVPDGSRAIPVHIIKLIDQDSSVIWLDETPLLPFSTKKTCGVCHDYNTVRTGLHFNAGDSAVFDGRKGQPWIYADPYSASLIPLSLRDWQGTFTPAEIGMTNFDFINRFGRHMPGGSVGDDENAQSLEKLFRWQVSGLQEINCLSCHNAERSHDQAEYAAQIMKQNFRWAATASSGFADVEGAAKDMPDNYDIYAGVNLLPSQGKEPSVSYKKERINEKSEVFFDITRDVPNERCYFCHSTKIIDPVGRETWQFDEDVHLKAGLNCVDCHRNGLDHNITRGYEDASESQIGKSMTCKGCHYGIENSEGKSSKGRLGAPTPEHRGIPPIHFTKLSCTTCHSGNWPSWETTQVKTSMAHGLGLHSTNRSDMALPHVFSPVFAINEQGIIEPNNLIWPSYWAKMDSNGFKPFTLQEFTSVSRPIIAHLDSMGNGDWPLLPDSTLVHVLDSLQTFLSEDKAVYVSGQTIYYLSDNKKLKSEIHELAKPYYWPIAHDVRPAGQSLGINGCNDCHSNSSAFYFSGINIDSPVQIDEENSISMAAFLNENILMARFFSFSFLFRPWLKYFMFLCSFILIAVLLIYSGKGFSKILIWVSNNEPGNK